MRFTRQGKGAAAATIAAALVLAVATAVALLADVIAPLGADASLAARLVHGERWLLVVGLGGAVASACVGTVVGALAGFWGGRWDALSTRMVEALGMFPTIVVVGLLVAVGPRWPWVAWIAALALVRVPEVVRLMRIEILRLRGSEMDLAARALGVGPARIVVRHWGPFLAAPLAHCIVFGVAVIAVVEASMSFVGIAVPTPGPSLGRLAAEGLSGTWQDVAAPVVVLVVMLGALYEVARWLRDVLDPRTVYESLAIRASEAQMGRTRRY